MFNTGLATLPCYSIEKLKEAASQLVKQGRLHRQQPIYTLCQYIPAREWPAIEWELERSEFLLRDRLIDLLAQEVWEDA
ncbi:MAG: DUF4327 family protein [Snowella sp.]|jgi:hypothetical protein|nr:DUF4327 family protein [Snowella sp.]PZV26821.1 MAG: DUF4327 domain-containing protein [Snowella sp.]